MYLSRFLAISIFVFIFYAAPAWAETPIMLVNEIETGMQGVGRTVISGTEIEEFDVEVIDIFSSLGYDGGPLIFVRLSGDVIDRSGGIAGGYSGSPVYIDGKLIGAVSWGPYFTEGDVAGITPINNMLRAFTYRDDDQPDRIASVPVSFQQPVEIEGRSYVRIATASREQDLESLSSAWGEDTLVLTPCSTPLIVSGLSPEGFEMLEEFASERLPYMDIIQGPGSGGSDGIPILLGPSVLEPGASIGAQLATGDLDITAVGTLTWVDDTGRFLAFGHPFLMDGPTNMPFITSRVIHTMAAMDRSYKMAEPIEIIGTVTQDRSTTIAGNLRQLPELIDFHLEVIDHDLDRTRRYDYSVINKEDWLSLFGFMLPMEAFAYTSDRQGPGTARINFSISGEGLKQPITRENLYYSPYSPTSDALFELSEALNMVTAANPYREVSVTDVDITVEITSAIQYMDIVEARFNNPPNMGPGAVGYNGPESMENGEDIYEAYDGEDLIDGSYDEYDVLQDMPLEELGIDMDMDYFDEYASDYVETELVGYYPGDTIELLVTLRPWRGDEVEEIIKLEIPDDFTTGATSVEIYSGSFYSYFGFFDGGLYSDSGFYIPPEDLDEVIENFMERDVNNSISVSLLEYAIEDPYYYLQEDFDIPEGVSNTVILNDVIMGYYSLPIEILSEESEMDDYYEDDGMYDYEAEDLIVYDDDNGSADNGGGNPHRD